MNKLLFLEGEEVIGPTFFCLFLNFHSVPGVIGTSTVYLYYVHKYENGEPVGMWKKRTNKKKKHVSWWDDYPMHCLKEKWIKSWIEVICLGLPAVIELNDWDN